uniref:receptor-type tyrosine-protein phosphatase eta-like n=1 Tax=Myxine glutinosa TaxID=7769 RepID=UPI00358F8946
MKPKFKSLLFICVCPLSPNVLLRGSTLTFALSGLSSICSSTTKYHPGNLEERRKTGLASLRVELLLNLSTSIISHHKATFTVPSTTFLSHLPTPIFLIYRVSFTFTMKPKGHRDSRFHGSMQGFLRLLLIQITVFLASSCAGPAPPLNITVVERNVPFVSVRWTAPNDSNKDSYRYHVELYRNTRQMYGTTVYNTEVTITHIVPRRNYTLTVTSYYNDKYSQPATIVFTTGPCGGKLRAEGWLSSPGYPQYIASTTDCVWDIEAPLGHVVFLTVVDLNYYYNYSPLQCNWAWLAVGYNQTSQRDITMCHHSDVGRTIESPSNTLRVFYQTSSDNRMRRFNVTLSSQDGCIPAQLKVVSYNITSVTLSWIVPNDLNNTFLSFVSLFSSGKEIQNHTTKYKEITITGLSPDSSYSVSISSLCNGTESIPATIDVQTGPSPPMNLTVVEQGVGFASLRWAAPNDPNKDNYTYHVAWYQYEYRKYSRTVHGTEINITSLSPGENSTVAVTSSYGNKSSLPATITFTAAGCIPAQLKVVSYSPTSVSLTWIVPNDLNNTHLSFVSLFSSGKEIQNRTTKSKEITITGLSPFTKYNVSISSLCDGTESIPARIDVQTGPSPPMNLTVVEQGVGFAFVRWTAPNDPNKDSYNYHVIWYQHEYRMKSRNVYGTEINITRLTPWENCTVSVTSSYGNKSSLPATITFTAVPCGGKVRAEGWLSSPGYSQNMYLNMDCVWDIEAPLGHVVVLTVVDLNYYYYYSSSQCYWSWLAVGYNQTSDRDVTMCHYSDVGRRIISTTNTLRLFYHVIPFNVTLSSQDGCIPAQLKVVSYSPTSVSLTWIVPNDLNNTHLSFVSLFSSGKEIQNRTTKSKEITITGLSPFTKYNVSISSLCDGTESIPARIDVQTGPSPPMNLTVVEQGVGFAFVRWAAPNDPNKDSYNYHVIWYQLEYRMKSRTVYGTEINITSLIPGINYTVTVTSSYGNKSSLPATITFTAVPCGGKVRAEGWLSSSGYPQNMYLNMDCVWDIEAPLGHIVVLTVVDLNYYYYYSSSPCYENWLAVGYNQTSDRDVTMCRYSDVGRRIISTTNTLRLFYHALLFNVTLSSQAPGKTSTSPPDTPTHAESSSETHLVLPTTAASGTTSTGSKSTAVLLLLSIAAKAFCDSMGLT